MDAHHTDLLQADLRKLIFRSLRAARWVGFIFLRIPASARASQVTFVTTGEPCGI
jgi:hypothetical protein